MINHPFLPRYYGKTKKNYIIFEYINGHTLTNIKEYHFSEKEKFTIVFHLLSVIYYLHKNHFIYRDLKPNNVMIDENKAAVLIDFDRMITENDQKDNKFNTNNFGLIFQAPEINYNNFNNKCDIYSIGQMIYFLFNEQNPGNLASTNISNFENNSQLSKIYEECINDKLEQRPSDIELIDNFCHFAAKTCFMFQNINSEALFNLGVIYNRGESIPRDINKAIHYFSLAANQNHLRAQYNLGYIYYLGDGVERNAYKEIDFLMQSSKNNHIAAHFPLGFFYQQGKYLERDITKSVSLYKEGSSFNDQYSKNNLGILYKNGFGDEFEKKWPISIIYFEEAIK